jgi:hypothetical protein
MKTVQRFTFSAVARNNASRRAGHQEIQMMKLGETVSAALVMGALLAALSGCQKQEGPAEHAGKEIDKAVERAGQQIEKAGDSIQDAAKGDKQEKK